MKHSHIFGITIQDGTYLSQLLKARKYEVWRTSRKFHFDNSQINLGKNISNVFHIHMVPTLVEHEVMNNAQIMNSYGANQ